MRKIIEKIKAKDEVVNLPFGTEECGKFLRNTYKVSIDDVVILRDELFESVLEYEGLVSEIKELEGRKKAIEHMMQSELKEFSTGFCRDRKVSWKSMERSSVDTKRLKEDYPDIVNSYVKISSSRVFKIK